MTEYYSSTRRWKMKFLHISDIHFDPMDSGRATRDLRNKFSEYVSEKGLTNIDELFFTGDFRHALKQANQDPDVVSKNAVDFLWDIASSIGIKSRKNIHIVPGNHDLDREIDSERNQQFMKCVYDNYEPYEGRFEGTVENCSVDSYLRGRFTFFEKCVTELDNLVWSDFKQGLIHRVRDFGYYSILYLNTAIACGRDNDRHNLLIGSNDFELAVQQTGGKPIIVLAHNPISHLAQDEKTILKNIIKDNNAPVLWLCGDVHETQYENTYNICCLAAGCMIQQKGTEASFYVGELTAENGVVIEAHEYQPAHGFWQPAEAITKRVRESIPDSLLPPATGAKPEINNLQQSNDFFTGRDKELSSIAKTFKKKD